MTFARTLTAWLALCSTALPATWGSFDKSRIEYPNGVFTSPSFTNLHLEIAAAGGSIAGTTDTLTNGYLAQVDVFFTSHLSVATGVLSAAEQEAMVDWVRCGGTLIVTAEYPTIAANDSFLAPFGITTSPGDPAIAPAVTIGVHPLVSGVTKIHYEGAATFTHGADASVLMKSSTSQPFALVLENTASTGAGRVFVTGDHRAFQELSGADEPQLRKNVAAWAEIAPPPPCATGATWSNYGAGWPGTLGVPSLTLDANPAVGKEVTLLVGSSSVGPASTLLVLGNQTTSIPSAWGGTLLVTPALVFPFVMPPSGLALPAHIPCDLSLCGQQLYLQVLQVDSGASQLVSFTRGLALTFGS